MKTRTLPFMILMLACAILCSQKLRAQDIVRPLPYSTGFDGDFVDEGWHPYQLQSTNFGMWGIAKVGALSPPNLITHDYPVDNTNAEIVEDWYVSPPIKVTGKSVIEIAANVYTISQREKTDYFGIWYSTKNIDPHVGDYKELADLTSFATNKFTNWRDTAGIILNDSGAKVYIAFKYRESTNWFTVGLDNFKIRLASDHSGVNSQGEGISTANLYPNPSHGSFTIMLPASIANQASHIRIYDMQGKLVSLTESAGKPDVKFNNSITEPGLYQYTVTGEDGKFFSGKLLVN